MAACARLLQEELTIRPMTDTLDLFDAIQAENSATELLVGRALGKNRIVSGASESASTELVAANLPEVARQIETASAMLKRGLATLDQLTIEKPKANSSGTIV